MQPTFMVETTNTTPEAVQCDAMGVTNDGSLLAFIVDDHLQSLQPIKGWANGQWNKFYKSSIAMQ